MKKNLVGYSADSTSALQILWCLPRPGSLGRVHRCLNRGLHRRNSHQLGRPDYPAWLVRLPLEVTNDIN